MCRIVRWATAKKAQLGFVPQRGHRIIVVKNMRDSKPFGKIEGCLGPARRLLTVKEWEEANA